MKQSWSSLKQKGRHSEKDHGCGLLEESHLTVSTRVVYRMLVDSEAIIFKGLLKNTHEVTGLFLGTLKGYS